MPDFADLLGASDSIVALRNSLTRLLQRPGAHSLPPILILGETGTGKGLLAQAIHRGGPRRAGPFIDVNCAAIPDHLLEAELFGFERGAFTDARQAKPGLFQAASGGTLFLDEVGLLPESAQAKVLKAIEDRVVRRLGRTQSEAVDVSIITATNADLADTVRAGRFRADLYHRIAVVVLSLPPLRDRGADILLLAQHFLTRACEDYRLPPRRLTADARAALRSHAWPGNVRELANVIERTVLLADDTDISASMLQLHDYVMPESAVSTDVTETPRALGGDVAVERQHIVEALEATAGNLSRAAARLGMPRNTLRYRMGRLGLGEGGKPGDSPRSPRPPAARAVTDLPGPGDATPRRRVVAALRLRLGSPWETASIAMRSRVLAVVVDRLRGFGARIEETGVDGCVAFFGLEPVEDAPRRAGYAAVAARQAVDRQSEQPGAAEGCPLCIAVHAASVSLFRVGDRWQIDPATRETFLEMLDDLVEGVDPGDIVVAPGAAPYLDRHFDLTPMDSNVSGPARVRLHGAKHGGYELWGRAARFVGRADELAQLRRLVQEAAAGRGQAVGLRGEPGAGKSRLLAELAGEVAGSSVRWLEASCPPYGTGIPFLTAIVLLRKCLDLEAGAPTDLIVRKVRASGSRTDSADELEAALVSLVGNLPEWHPFMMLPALRRRTLVVSAASRLLLSAGGPNPLVVAIEDLQWIDRESQDVLDALRQAIPGTRVLLAATYRPDYRQTWRDPSSSEIQLGPLPPESAEELLDDLLGRNVSLVRVRGEILAKTGGNPFYLEESVRAMVDSGVVAGSRGAFRMVDTAALLTVPENVQAVVAARMDQLTPRRRRVLQCAAAVGQSGTVALLSLVCDLPPVTAQEEIAALRDDVAFFSPGSGDARGAWEFRHAVTHEAAYGTLLELERKLLHAKVFRSMERLRLGDETEHAELLADQAMRGEIWDRAIDYCRIASARAYARAALEEAIASLERALQFVDRLPASVEAASRAIDVRLDLHPALLTVGRIRDIAELHPESERLARQLDDRVRLAQVLRQRSQLSWMTGRYRTGADYARQALALLNTAPDGAARTQSMYSLGQNLHAFGDYRGAERCFAWIVEGPDTSLIDRVSALTVPMDSPAWCWRGFTLALSGDFARSLEATSKGVALAETCGYDQSRVIAWTIEAIIFNYAGRAAERVDRMEEVIALCEKIGFVAWLPPVYSTYGFLLTRLGRKTETALHYLEQAVVANEKMGLRVYHAQRLCWWAEGLLRARNLLGARLRADAAVELATSMEERGIEAEALLTRALVAQAEGTPVEAQDDLTRALAISRTLEARPFEAQCHLRLAAVLETIGKIDEATNHRERGQALCREMTMRPWWPDA